VNETSKRPDHQGISTEIRPGSDWFAGTPSSIKKKEDKERKLMEEIKSAREDEKLRIDARSEQRERQQKLTDAGNQSKHSIAQQRAKEKAQHQEDIEIAERKKWAEKDRTRREEAERRKNDPKYLATLAERRRKDDERMAKVVVEVKVRRTKKPIQIVAAR